MDYCYSAQMALVISRYGNIDNYIMQIYFW